MERTNRSVPSIIKLVMETGKAPRISKNAEAADATGFIMD